MLHAHGDRVGLWEVHATTAPLGRSAVRLEPRLPPVSSNTCSAVRTLRSVTSGPAGHLAIAASSTASRASDSRSGRTRPSRPIDVPRLVSVSGSTLPTYSTWSSATWVHQRSGATARYAWKPVRSRIGGCGGGRHLSRSAVQAAAGSSHCDRGLAESVLITVAGHETPTRHLGEQRQQPFRELIAISRRDRPVREHGARLPPVVAAESGQAAQSPQPAPIGQEPAYDQVQPGHRQRQQPVVQFNGRRAANQAARAEL